MYNIEIDGLDNVDLVEGTIEVTVGLDTAHVTYDNSAQMDVDPYEYYLTSSGIYTGRLDNGVPSWLADYVSLQLGSNLALDTNDVITTLKGRLDNAETGINQNLQSIQTTNTSLNSLESTLVSRLNGNDASILELDTTRVTADEALTIATNLQISTFGNDVEAYITNITASYASTNLAYASDYDLLVATYNDLSVRLEDTRQVSSGMYSEWDGISTPIIGQFKYESNQWYQYLGGTVGPNNDGWQITSSAAIKNTVDDTNFELTTFAATVNSELTDLQSQIDGNITSWFHTYDTEYVSTDATYQSTQTGVNLVRCDLVWHVDTMYVFLSEIDTQNIDLNLETYPSAGRWRAVTNLAPDVKNYPAGQWTTNEERNNHLGDLAYNLVTGYAYRWTYEDLEDDPDQGLIYGWLILTDTDITSVLAAAAKAQDTADGKRITFYQNTIPQNITGSNGYIVVISEGDLWIPSDTNLEPTYVKEDLYIYKEGTGWVKATKYTDDTAANRTVRAFSAILASPPTAESEGDLWTVTNQWYTASTGTTYGTTKTEYGRVVKRYTSGSWVTVANETRKLFSDVAWAGYASSLLYDPVSGGITGWEYGDGGTADGINTRSEFKINADIFKVANGTENYVPFTVNTIDHVVEFNGKVSFTNITDTPVINKTWVQTTQPSTGMIAGDTWIDTDDNNKMYSYDGTTWNPVGAGIKTYLQTTAPTTNLSVGDIWVDSDDNYKQYRYNGTSFVAIAYNPATAINAGTTTISGGKLTTGSVTATQIAAGSITTNHIATAGLDASIIKAGVIYNTGANESTYTMKISLDDGYIHIK